MTAVWARTLPMFRGVRKSGVVSAMTAIRRTSIRAGPARSRNRCESQWAVESLGESGDEAFASWPSRSGRQRPLATAAVRPVGVLGSTHPLIHHFPPEATLIGCITPDLTDPPVDWLP